MDSLPNWPLNITMVQALDTLYRTLIAAHVRCIGPTQRYVGLEQNILHLSNVTREQLPANDAVRVIWEDIIHNPQFLNAPNKILHWLNALTHAVFTLNGSVLNNPLPAGMYQLTNLPADHAQGYGSKAYRGESLPRVACSAMDAISECYGKLRFEAVRRELRPVETTEFIRAFTRFDITPRSTFPLDDHNRFNVELLAQGLRGISTMELHARAVQLKNVMETLSGILPNQSDAWTVSSTTHLGEFGRLEGSPKWADHPKWADQEDTLAGAPFDASHTGVTNYTTGTVLYQILDSMFYAVRNRKGIRDTHLELKPLLERLQRHQAGQDPVDPKLLALYERVHSKNINLTQAGVVVGEFKELLFTMLGDTPPVTPEPVTEEVAPSVMKVFLAVYQEIHARMALLPLSKAAEVLILNYETIGALLADPITNPDLLKLYMKAWRQLTNDPFACREPDELATLMGEVVKSVHEWLARRA